VEDSATRRELLQRYLPVAALVCWLALCAGVRVLTLPEEGRYVSIALAMARTGDWLTPTLNGLPFLDKPPLFYWIEASALSLVGGIQWPARVAPLLGATVGAASIWNLVRRRGNEKTARWTLVVLATMPIFFGGAQFANMDMLAAGCISLTICLAAEVLLREEAPGRRLIAALWVSAAIGMLAKGLIGVVLPVLVIAPWAVATRRAANVRPLFCLPAIALFVLLAVPWFAFQELVHPGFARYFFIHQHVDRFAGSGFNSARAWWFYLAALPLLTLPWCLWLLASRRSADGRGVNAPGSVSALMWTWLGTVLVFFSIPESKPIGYIMPALFPMAFLVADAVCAGGRLRSRMDWLSTAIGALAALAYVLVSASSYDEDHRMLGRTLGLLRGTEDPVTFVGNYYYDVPIYARLEKPVQVVGRWDDPAFAKADDWRRELADAASFARDRATKILVDRRSGLEAPCGLVLWAISPTAERQASDLSRARAILESNGAILWRFPARTCAETN
jgi:4-amino-4-deoxy-L-arabinose transferase-like glycosyltransferase